MSTRKQPTVPPRWFVTTAWKVHRGLYRITGHRFGLWAPGGSRGWGALELTTTGRSSGEPRRVIVGYLEDAGAPIVVAMNGWGEGEPAWWRNLQANPSATIRERHGAARSVMAREAVGAERDRLWALWREVEPRLDEYAALRRTRTAVVVLAPA